MKRWLRWGRIGAAALAAAALLGVPASARAQGYGGPVGLSGPGMFWAGGFWPRPVGYPSTVFVPYSPYGTGVVSIFAGRAAYDWAPYSPYDVNYFGGRTY